VEVVLNKVAPAVEGIDVAQANPECVFITGLGADASLEHAQAARSFARCSVLHIYYGRVKGNFNMAEAAIRRCLRLSRDLRPRGFMVCQLVSVANDGTLILAINRLLLTDPNLTVKQCDRLLALLIEHQQQGMDSYQEGLRMDYILARSSIHDLKSGRLTLGQIFDFLSTTELDGPKLVGHVPMNYDAEIVACNRLYALAMREAKDPIARTAEFFEFDQEIAKISSGWTDFLAKAAVTPPSQRASLQSQMPATQFQTWTASVVPGRDATRRAAAYLAGLQMLVALRRYEVAHGRLPTALEDAAVETALKSVPIDPYAGMPLRLTKVGDRTIVYSVGKDLKDDGGLTDWNFGAQPGDILFVLPPRDEAR
jgi:hypothetical protein